MTAYLDYTSPSLAYAFDVNKSPLMKKDKHNFINILGIAQLNTLENVSLLDIFLSTGNAVEPHYHQNAAELVYCISGKATVSLLNPFTKNIQNYTIGPGQVANVPQGWWHYEVALQDNTHLLAIFNAPTPEVILGSDILKFTPANIMANTYCIDENQWNETVAQVQPTAYIGPANSCSKSNKMARRHHYSYGHQGSTSQRSAYSRAGYWPVYPG
ncbi:cupin domain-containing protein [Bacillus sp. MMSF_3328]|uniref:cupin domain-containing protein n=1 Tax=Bacillus sp. MMSF_3328 TaxID=3047080 RepID=UPI00273DBFA1|nr:cupin domain-containing protein [Bacillus sp. MMSF_3328]